MDRTSVRWRLALAFAAAVCSVVYALGGRAGAGPIRPPRKRVYVVQPGDSVWSIAQRSVGGAGDPRPLVDELIRINGLSHRVLVPGELVVVPADPRPATG